MITFYSILIIVIIVIIVIIIIIIVIAIIVINVIIIAMILLRPTLGMGRMGSAVMGSLLISCFLTDFSGTPFNLFVSSQYFPNLSNVITFAVAPLVLTPFVRNQSSQSGHSTGLRR